MISSSKKRGLALNLWWANQLDRARLAALSIPAIAVVGAALLIPLGWLVWLSFHSDAGVLTVANYTRLAEPIYVSAFLTTLKISFLVTAACTLIGYPLAYLLVQLTPRMRSVALLFVLVPFWTSLLVRTYAWIAILQRKGIVNTALLNTGLIESPLPLLYNVFGVVVGMTHIMLPFLVLPLMGSMSAFDGMLTRAANSLGASPRRAFWTVFFPLSLPGLLAGSSLVFVLSLGLYVTPALLGGSKVHVWAMRIENDVSLYGNWGVASAVGVVLVLTTSAVLLAFSKFIRIRSASR